MVYHADSKEVNYYYSDTAFQLQLSYLFIEV